MLHPHVVTALASLILAAPGLAQSARRVISDRGLGAPPPGALQIVAESPAMRQAVEDAETYAPAQNPVVFYGPTGSGKTLLAHHLHRLSGRPGEPLVVTAAELPEELAEALLFGYERGAFTGAYERHEGLIAQAGERTLFLDDFAQLPIPVQAKLLRGLGDGVYRRVGGKEDLPVRCRFVFGLSDHPDALVKNGLLLIDIRARMGECLVAVPPLADRPEDVARLAQEFLERCPERLGVSGGPTSLAPEALAAFQAASWPRNARQLRDTIERGYLHARRRGAAAIGVAHLPAELHRAPSSSPLPVDLPSAPPLAPPAPEFVPRGDPEQNMRAVEGALERTGWRQDLAAAALGVHPNTIAAYVRRLRREAAPGATSHRSSHSSTTVQPQLAR